MKLRSSKPSLIKSVHHRPSLPALPLLPSVSLLSLLISLSREKKREGFLFLLRCSEYAMLRVYCAQSILCHRGGGGGGFGQVGRVLLRQEGNITTLLAIWLKYSPSSPSSSITYSSFTSALTSSPLTLTLTLSLACSLSMASSLSLETSCLSLETSCLSLMVSGHCHPPVSLPPSHLFLPSCPLQSPGLFSIWSNGWPNTTITTLQVQVILRII
jgi:hypothetical protein